MMEPERGGTIHTQSAGQPPRRRCSFSKCFMKDSAAEWWSTMVTFKLCGEVGGKVGWVGKVEIEGGGGEGRGGGEKWGRR